MQMSPHHCTLANGYGSTFFGLFKKRARGGGWASAVCMNYLTHACVTDGPVISVTKHSDKSSDHLETDDSVNHQRGARREDRRKKVTSR